MWYYIYIAYAAGQYELIGQTRHKNDAVSVLDNWDSGYIKQGRTIVISKNPYTQRS